MPTLLPADLQALATLPSPHLTRALSSLRENAEKALTGPFSVTADKRLPPSGDPHDYRSWGSYWWPDPTKPDGLPWIRRDGVLHPDAHSGNRDAMDTMILSVRTLAVAYRQFGDERFAEHAAGLLRAWFLDAETKMNPHLRYAQAIPGICEGRGIGLIDTRGLIWVPDAVRLLRGSAAWTAADDQGLLQWFDQYRDWFFTSDLGQDEIQQQNNHGSCYDLQLAVYAMFTGHREQTRTRILNLAENRVLKLVQPDGSITHELTRTISYDYVLFHLRLLLNGVHLGRHFELDLVRPGAPAGDRLRAAVDWLEPHVATQANWPGQQIAPFRLFRMGETLSLAAWVLHEPRYAAWLDRLPEPYRQRTVAEYLLALEPEL